MIFAICMGTKPSAAAAVLMSTLPAHSVLLLQPEEDGWTCSTTSYIRDSGREPHPA